MSFWIIFLSLVIGAAIGYEFGKYTVTKRLHTVLDDLGKELQKVSDDLKKKKEQQEALKKEQQKNLAQLMLEMGEKWSQIGLASNEATKDILKEQGANEDGQRN